jgi:hypothetical protein
MIQNHSRTTHFVQVCAIKKIIHTCQKGHILARGNILRHRCSTYTSPSLAHVCSNRPADSTRIVSYIRRQYVRTVPNVDIVGSSRCHTRHLATGGVACFNNVLVTNSNPVTTCPSDGRVNPYPNMTRLTCMTCPKLRNVWVNLDFRMSLVSGPFR